MVGNKKIKVGSNDKDTLDLLKSLKASDFVAGGKYDIGTNGENLVLQKWNNLQSTPVKRRTFTFMDFRQSERIIAYLVKNYPNGSETKWAYIFHNKDSSEHKHHHFYLEFKNPRSFASVANEFNMPVTNLEGVRDKKAILQYLTHENEPNKHHYDLDEVHSNFDYENERKIEKIDIIQEFEDYMAYKRGEMTYNEFLLKYNHSFTTMNFNNRLNVYDKMDRERSQGTQGLSACRVPSSKAPP